MIRVICLSIVLFFLNHSNAQLKPENCNCCSKNYQSFDFWVGEWDVFNTDNQQIGENSITKQYDNCVLQEKWVSKGILKGTSYSFFNKVDASWNQIWVDNTGYTLQLKGAYSNNRMVLKSNLLKQNGNEFYNQITWIKNNDGTVTQLWETFTPDNKKIAELFRGIYKKKLKNGEN